MAYEAIVGRRLDRPIVNLGFSGNGKMELELADLLGAIDAGIYVLDSLANLDLAGVTARLEPFYRRLRQHRPHTPIVLMEYPRYAQAEFVPIEKRRTGHNDIACRVYDKCRGADAHLHYVCADEMLGSDGDATVDGCHPTDLGFWRIAEVLTPALRELG
jgi:hypothetical protein